MKFRRVFISAVLAGFSVGLGGVIFLSLDNKVIGSALFTTGLFVICSFGLHLYTGKACYVLDNDKSYALSLIPIWLGNFAGSIFYPVLRKMI